MNDEVKPNWLDKTISYISPKRGAERLAYRQLGTLQASYRGAIGSRVSTPWGQSESMGGIPHLNQNVSRAMRDRARSLVENNALAAAILDRAVENIIGHGFKLQPLTSDPQWNAQAESLMNNWFHHADYNGRSWNTVERINCYSLLRDGDVGTALLGKGQIQLIEGDYVSSPPTKPEAFLHDGIELDTTGRVKQYHVMTYVDLKNRSWQTVAPKDLIFVARKRRANQWRGETSYAQSFDLFDQIKGYTDAVVLAQKIAACLALFIVQNDSGSIAGLNYGKNAKGQSQREMNLEPGMIQRLQQGEDIRQITPSQPGSGFDINLRMLIRLLGISFGLPLEYVLLDFSTVSGATAKASAQAAQRSFESVQRLLIDEWYTRIYRWRISKFIKDGELADRQDKFNHRWNPEPWPYLDPVKEIQAKLLAIDGGLDTEHRVILASGGNPDHLIAERAAELARKRELNIPIYHTSYMQEIGTAAPVSTEESDGTEDTDTEAPNSDMETPSNE